MKKESLFLLLLALCLPLFAQPQEQELKDPQAIDITAWNKVKNVSLGWGSIDQRYAKHTVPTLAKSVSLRAWRGERVSAQAVVIVPSEISKLSVTVSNLKNGKYTIPSEKVNKYFVGYTLADPFVRRDGTISQNHSDHSLYDSMLVADRLKPATEMAVESRSVRPVWLDIRIPQDAQPGIYKGFLTVRADNKRMSIPFSVEVNRHVLPPAAEWSFHLDLWQNPYAVARYYNVPLWSKEHFDYMRPIMKLLADAGQKVITTSIIQHPWNGQTEDPFESMIGKTKTLDGKWTYNYSVFDRWVEFMMSVGITEQIDCYTLVPWHLQFEYFDEAKNATQSLHLTPGTAEYKDFLLPFLKDFAKHLKAKGWFDKTCIAMDERPMNTLRAAWDVLYEADPNYKIEGAAKYYPEVEPKMYDLCLYYTDPKLESEVINARKSSGKKTTFYTCCGPRYPNTFLVSTPAESAYMGWHAMAAGFDGYLRWAYNSWVKSPNQDSRYRSWTAGDCYFVYPGGSSIRLERLVQGIQDYEKIRILKKELSNAQQQELTQALKPFEANKVEKTVSVTNMVNTAENILWKLSK